MLNYIKAINSREQFKPGIIGFIINPYFFNRRSIYKGIKVHANLLKGRLLDFGCGTKAYSKLFQVSEHIGVDIENNEGHNLDTSFVDVFYDGKKLPFGDDHFDSVFSSEVFEHIPNLDEVLTEINRVHKKSGLLLITLPFVWREHEMPNDFGRYTSSGIEKILSKSNYEIVSHFKKPGHFISLIQLFTVYMYHHIFPKPNILKLILTPLFIFPIHLISYIVNFILPDKNDFFINQTILAKNIKK